MSFNSTLIGPTNEPHLKSFTHNLHSLIPFMRSEALTFMVGRYISPLLLVSPLSCMVMGGSGHISECYFLWLDTFRQEKEGLQLFIQSDSFICTVQCCS